MIFIAIASYDLPAQNSADGVAVSNKCWDFPTDSIPESGLVSDTYNIYFAAAGGRITAIDAVSGKSAWTAELGGRAISNIVVHGPDIIAVTAAVSDAGQVRNVLLRSLSKVTGIVNWTVDLPPSEKVFLGANSSGIVAVSDSGPAAMFDYRNGAALWTNSEIGQVAARPYIDQDYTIIPFRTGRTFVLSTKNGSSVSTIESPVNIETQTRAGERSIVNGDSRGNLIARDLISGKRQWKFKAGAKWIFVERTKDGIAAISADNFVYMLSAYRGSVRWKRRLPGRISGSPAFSDSYAVLASYGENSAYVIDMRNGRIVNLVSLAENSSFSDSPILISDDSVAATTNAGVSLWSFGPCGQIKKAALSVPPR